MLTDDDDHGAVDVKAVTRWKSNNGFNSGFSNKCIIQSGGR